MTGFSCQASVDDSQTVVAVSGDVDLAVVDVFWETLDTHLDTGRVVVLDCSRVEFLDSMGLRILVKASQKANEVGATFRLGECSPAVQRVLDLAGFAEAFSTDSQ
ncbi:hypothetical protein GCM10009839_01720 [Catenulispora yoronensis]|uniref:Anti-sigma factor antagonist n=1 Tax=Catenulispora yoronensis TaxID=450799 RepID=A0ABP5EYN3_9ACTN